MNISIKKVPGVKLNSRLGSPYFENASALGLIKSRRQRQCPRFPGSQNPVVIVALGKLQLRVVIIDTRANGGRCRKIEGGTLNLPQFSRGNQRGIHRGKSVRMDHELVLKNVSVPLTGQVKV